MLFTLLRVIDVLAFVGVLFSPILPSIWLGSIGLLLFFKGVLFIWTLDVASFLDMACGLVIIGFVFGISFTLLKVLVLLYLGQKLVLSFF